MKAFKVIYWSLTNILRSFLLGFFFNSETINYDICFTIHVLFNLCKEGTLGRRDLDLRWPERVDAP